MKKILLFLFLPLLFLNSCNDKYDIDIILEEKEMITEDENF